MVNEMDGQVEVCVTVKVPQDKNIGDVTFRLTMETQNGNASMSNSKFELIDLICGWNFCISNNILETEFVK